ncbi:MAG: kynureninase [Chloroflexales bacterium]|nr:kynureninase [Chloroflexales bacterium]
MLFRADADYARELDASDELAHVRNEFVIADPDQIYLDGNSLGRLPKATAALTADIVNQQWGERLIRGWNEGWFTAPERIGAKIAQLIGADPDEVIVADSTSINLFKLVVAVLRAFPQRSRILTDDLNFPSDLYILQGIIDLLGAQHQVHVARSPDSVHGPVVELRERLDADAALLTLSHTVFKSGYVYDMAELTAAAHAHGALTLWDLSHSVGAVPLDLHAAGADMAIGCTYKYLNGGPGSPAFLFIRRDLQERLHNPITGWMGQQNPFDFDLRYRATPGMRHFLTGTPQVVSLALIEPGLDVLLAAGMDRVRAKSVRQSEYLIQLWEALLAPLGFSLNSPRDPRQRGSHVSLGHPQGLYIDLALINDMNVLPDFRMPDNIRLGIAPLYTSFSDIHTAVTRMRQIVVEGLFEKYVDQAPVVT